MALSRNFFQCTRRQLKLPLSFTIREKVTALAAPLKKAGREKTGGKKERWGVDIPNPFEGKPLPFDKVLYKPDWFEQKLKEGHGWMDRDRMCKWHDWNEMEDASQDYEADLTHPYEDLLYPWDDDFQYKLQMIDQTLAMLKSIPDLQPHVKELEEKFAKVFKTGMEELKERVDEMVRIEHETKGGPLALREAAGEIVTWNPEPEKTDSPTDWIHKLQDIVDRRWVDDRIAERDYVRLQFIDAVGKKYMVYGMVGETLLNTCRRWEVPIDGLCQGGEKSQLYGEPALCYWCQVDLAPTYWHLVPSMPHVEVHHHYHMRTHTPTSRLACCVTVQKDFDGMTVSIPVNNPSLNGRDGGVWC